MFLVKVYVPFLSEKLAFEDAKQADILANPSWPKQVKMGWKHLLGIPKEQLRQKIELIGFGSCLQENLLLPMK